MNDGLLLGVFLLCLAASAFFSGSETAITTVSEASLFRLRESGSRSAERVVRLRERLSRTLSTLLIGNTLVNIAAGSIGTALAIPHLGEKWGVVAATVGTTLILLVVGEATPKTLAARRPEEFALLAAPAVELLVRWLSPFSVLLSGIATRVLVPLGAGEERPKAVTEEDVKSVISLSHERGELEAEETEILHAVLDFGDLPVKEAMLPRARIVGLPHDANFEAVEAVCREHRYSRYPVWRDDPDEVVGVLHVKDLFDVTDEQERTFSLSRHLRPALFVPELKKASELFREMRRRRSHMVFVVDERGTLSGLVTLEDLVEQIVGEIADEHDEPQRRPLMVGAALIVEGTYPLDSLQAEVGLALEEAGAATVAGLLLLRFGRIPRAGARTRVGELEFLVERASARAIERVRVTRRAPAEAAGSDRVER